MMRRILLFTSFLLVVSIAFSKGRYQAFYVKGNVVLHIKGDIVKVKERDYLNAKDIIDVPSNSGLILKDEKGHRICVIKKPYKGRLSSYIKESDDEKSIIDCTVDFFKYLGKRCFGEFKDDSSYMKRTASTARGENPEVISSEDQYIDNINEIVNNLEIDLKFQ